MHTVIVIAGGWSVSQYDVADLRKYGHVVGVNESAVLKAVNVGVTMDRLWAEHRSRRYFLESTGDLWVRRDANKSLPQHPRLNLFDCDYEATEMSVEARTLNGTNSGMCALNYAYHRQPDRLFLFGFDMCKGPEGESYYHPPYEWAPEGGTKPGKYKEWSKQFNTIARQFRNIGTKVYNVNNRTKIESFPVISFEQFLEIVK